MAFIKLTIPETLELKVQGFEPQAAQAMRDLCTKSNVDNSLTEVLLKDLAGFLRGHRIDDIADIDRVTKEIQDNEIFRNEISNCGYYYISRMIYHFLYCEMLAGAFGELVRAEDDGRLFFHDYCAIAKCYLNATISELNAIQIDGVKFDDAPMKGVTGTGQEFLWDSRNRENTTKRAIDTAKEWKKNLPDKETEQRIATQRSLMATFANGIRAVYGNSDISLEQAVWLYNQQKENEAKGQYYPVQIVEVESFIWRLFLDLKNKVLMREVADGYECYITIVDLYKHIHNETKSPSEKEFRSFVSLLEFLTEKRFWIYGLITEKRGKGLILKQSKAKVHLITIPMLAAENSRNEVIKIKFDKCIIQGYNADGLQRLNGSNEEQKNARAYDRMLLMPAEAVNDVQRKNPVPQHRFEALMKVATNMTEEHILQHIFGYDEQEQEILAESNENILRKAKIEIPEKIEERSKLANDIRTKELTKILKYKSRERKNLPTRFQKAVEHGVIFNPKRMPIAGGKKKKPEYKWEWNNKEPKTSALNSEQTALNSERNALICE